MFHRIINPFKNNTFFLFGARGTGKTTFLKERFKDNKNVLNINFLDQELERKFILNPNELIYILDSCKKEPEWVFIDEIQKVPAVLDVIHMLSNETDIKFALTGSNARKLKRGGANLLAGRAFVFNLYPLSFLELDKEFNLKECLNFGSLPGLINLDNKESKKLFLKAYTNTYIKEEIRQEQIVRKLDPFLRFLEVASQMDAEEINYSSIARQVGADTKTVQSYFSILEDTLLGNLIHPYHVSIRKTQTKSSKFYFFDCGVKKALENTLNIEVQNKTYEFGKNFENFIFNECIKLNSYFNKDYKFFFFRTKAGVEIDMIIERPGMPLALIEIKSTKNISPVHVNSLNKASRAFESSEAFCFSLDENDKKIDNVWCLHWKKGLKEIGLIK
jgi:uncharacterized protein